MGRLLKDDDVAGERGVLFKAKGGGSLEEDFEAGGGGEALDVGEGMGVAAGDLQGEVGGVGR